MWINQQIVFHFQTKHLSFFKKLFYVGNFRWCWVWGTLPSNSSVFVIKWSSNKFQKYQQYICENILFIFKFKYHFKYTCLYIRTILNFPCVSKHKITYNIKWYFRLFTINWRFSRSPKNYSHFKRKVNRLYRCWFWLFSFDEKYRQYIVLLINAFVKLKRDTLKNACAITTVVVVLFKNVLDLNL